MLLEQKVRFVIESQVLFNQRNQTQRLEATNPGTTLRTATVPNTRRLEALPGAHRSSKRFAGTRKGPKASSWCRQGAWKAFWTARWVPGSACRRLALGTAVVLKGVPGLVASRRYISGRPHDFIFSTPPPLKKSFLEGNLRRSR